MMSLRTTLTTAARVWPSLSRERRALGTLDRAQLADIGLDADTARREAIRPFWDRPSNR